MFGPSNAELSRHVRTALDIMKRSGEFSYESTTAHLADLSSQEKVAYLRVEHNITVDGENDDQLNEVIYRLVMDFPPSRCTSDEGYQCTAFADKEAILESLEPGDASARKDELRRKCIRRSIYTTDADDTDMLLCRILRWQETHPYRSDARLFLSRDEDNHSTATGECVGEDGYICPAFTNKEEILEDLVPGDTSARRAELRGKCRKRRITVTDDDDTDTLLGKILRWQKTHPKT
ncbi:hypothetical protein BDZ88DRAFT_70571 [Geranomyces variabilis]|nr:hypothetical protein BDZ88DRAFT_70571 [Geranomyces variabilis]KAJ3134992.1 hypothetical protein HDU90_004317 [Geranomyces variabilis]